MRKGQERQADIVGAHAEELLGGPDVRRDVVVGQHHALRRPGRARGVDHRRDVFGRGPPGPGLEVASVRVVAAREEIVPRDGAFGGGQSLEDHDLHLAVEPRHRLAGLFQLLGVGDEDQRRAGVLDDVGNLRGGKRAVDRHVHHARAEARPVGERPLGAVLGEDGGPVAAPDTRLAKRRRAPPRDVGHLCVGVGPGVSAGDVVRGLVRKLIYGTEEQLDQGALRHIRRVGVVVDRVCHGLPTFEDDLHRDVLSQ